MGIQINGQTDRISAVDGSFSIQDLVEVNVTGVATASNFKSGTSNVHSTGYECTNINATGIVTAASANFTGNVSVGGTLTYQDVTNIDSVGIVTARAGVHVTGGNVAVGHNNPSVNLHVKGSASNGQIYLGGTGAHSQIYADNDGVLILNADQGNSAANSYLGFNVDNSERLRIDSSGNLLLRTGEIDMQGGNKTVKTSAGFLQLGTSGSHHTAIITAGSERLRITSDGKMGVGCTPETDFQVRNANGGTLKIGGSGNSATGFQIQYNNSGNTTTEILTNYRSTSSSASLKIDTGTFLVATGTSGTERLRITSGGDVLIADTTNSVYNDTSGGGINLKGNGQIVTKKEATSTADPLVWLNDTGQTTNRTIALAQDGTERGYLGLTGTSLSLGVNGGDRLLIDSAGNMGLGVTPITPGNTALHIGETTSGHPVRLHMTTANTGHTISDGFTLSIDGSSSAVNLIQREGAPIQFYTNGGERMRLFGTGACLQINSTSSSPTTGGFQLPQISIKQVASNWTGGIHIESSSSTKLGVIANTEDGFEISQSYRSGTSYGPILFRTSGVVRSKLLANGYFQMGSGYLGSTDYHRFNGINDTQGDTFFVLSGYQGSGGSSGDTAIFNSCNTGASTNSSATAMRIFRNSSTTRSINASGTINASGADYAEYMTKAGNFTLAKGDVCGVNSEGKLTNVFADAISFVVKSTDPSYVGGDKWHEVAGVEPGGYDDTRTEEEIAAAKVVYEEAVESARQLVDRIAFSGQVPVNVTGATPGQHIIPTAASDGSIEGTAKAEADLTMVEYMSSVGKVIAIEDDGRARIIVKVA